MRRHLLTLTAFAALATWAAGQGPAPGASAGERLDAFARNRDLVEDMVARGLDLANANTAIDRAEACRKTTADLARSLKNAAAADDPARVVEVGEYLDAVIREALVPALADAKRLITSPHSPDAPRLAVVFADAVGDAAAFVPAGKKVAASARAKAVQTQLGEARERLAELR